jgi:hypothetical protein
VRCTVGLGATNADGSAGSTIGSRTKTLRMMKTLARVNVDNPLVDLDHAVMPSKQ